MGIRDYFNVGKEVISSFKDIVIHDDSINNSIAQAGGLVSLIGIGLELYGKYQNSKKSLEQKAYASLLKFAFQITNDLLKDVREKEEEHARSLKYNWNTMHEELLKPFEENSDWNSYLPDHPAVQEFKSKIVNYLEEQGYDSARVNDFVFKFDLYVENNADTDPTIKEFNDYSKILQQYKDLVLYLEHVEDMKDYALSLDRKPLCEYYVNRQAVFTTANDSGLADDELRDKYSTNIKNVDDLIKEELLDQDKDRWYIVVGASFGVGKTSMARIVASRYGSKYLDKTEGLSINKTKNYIPILVLLKDGLRVEYRQYSLGNLFEKIVAPQGNRGASNRMMLLILDALDEYSENAPLMDELDSLHSKYPNIKVIITTRPDVDLLTKHKIKADVYLRLLQFTKTQIDEFFMKYGTKVNAENLTYGKARELNLPIDELSTPLFAWILSIVIHDHAFKMEAKIQWNSRMMKSYLFMLFFQHVIKGEYRERHYIKEKESLRIIAALKQVYGKDLTLNIAEEIARRSGFLNAPLNNLKILPSYFFYLGTTTRGDVIDFVHKKFQEYLLAEFYIKNLLVNNKYPRLNIGIPSRETIIFLDGLIDLIARAEGDVASRYINEEQASLFRSLKDKDVQDKASLFRSLKDKDVQDKAIETLKKNCLEIFKEESIVFSRAHIDEENEQEKIWKSAKIDTAGYKCLWIHRWISFHVLTLLEDKLELDIKDRERLGELTRYSSNFIPGYIKNFSKSNLCGMDFRRIDLSEANLTSAIVSSPTSSTYLMHADLARADLSEADLSNANLEGADLSEANMERTKLMMAFLPGARLYRANLVEVNLKGANASGSNFFNTKLFRPIFSNTDLSCANLQLSMIIDCHSFQRLICDDADFNGSIINNRELVNYLRMNNAKNVPDAITKKEDLKSKDLVKLGFKEEYVEEVLRILE